MVRPIVFVLVALCLFSTTTFAAVPSSITVQGRLTDLTGAPLPAGSKLFGFRLFSDSTGGFAFQVWPPSNGTEFQNIVTDAAGLWIARVGAVLPLSDINFRTPARWLEINVDGTTLPRVRLVNNPWSFRTGTVDSASGGMITSSVSIGSGHTNSGVNCFAAGQNNTTSGNWTSIPGGTDNIASDTGAVVAGGGHNRARGLYATVGGGGGSAPGDSNLASGGNSTVGGGRANAASNLSSTVGGGSGNVASNGSSTVAGGSNNEASGSAATIAGGSGNEASGSHSFVGGGLNNFARGDRSTIAGGGGLSFLDSNLASGDRTFIGGGVHNITSGNFAVICGGGRNRAAGDFATVGGGGGGFSGTADSNSAAGHWSTVPGGRANRANGNYAFAAGRRAKADHGGTFVWGDSTDANFTSTSPNQFLIRAAGGVGIGTNNPEGPLHVMATSAGTVTANASSIAVFERSTGGWLSMLSADASQRGILFSEPGMATAGAIVFDNQGANDLSFRTGGNTTHMTLDSAGNLHVSGGISGDGNLFVDGNITAGLLCCPSDARFKRNIETLPNALDMVGQLRGVRYEWQCEKFADRKFPAGQQVGLIAQEVREVVPEAVIEQSDGYLAVDYARLVPLLIEGMKEQQNRIERLEATIKSMTP